MDVSSEFECGYCEHCWVCIAWQEKDWGALNRYFMRTRGENLREVKLKVEGGNDE